MSGHHDEWTVATLKAYNDEQLRLLMLLLDERAQSQKTAIDKLADATTIRFEGVNEFRGTLTDQAAHFVTQDQLDAVAKDVTTLTEQMNLMSGHDRGASRMWVAGLGFVAALTTVLSLILAFQSGEPPVAPVP